MAAVPFATINADIRKEFNSNGARVDVSPRVGAPFDIKGFMKRQPVEELSDGLTQQGYYLRVNSKDWDAKAGKNPEKGDQVVVYGRRYAVERWQLVGLADIYVMLLRG